MCFILASATLALATVASATVFEVKVGQNGLEYTPSSVNASAGDQIEFIFYPKNHTVTQSTFANPCQSMANGSDSGFMPVNTSSNATPAPSMFVTINNTDPVWFYCRQTGHCQLGMVFAVNPTANETFEAFQAAASASTGGSSSNSSGTSDSGSGSSGSSSAASSAPSSTSSSSGNGSSNSSGTSDSGSGSSTSGSAASSAPPLTSSSSGNGENGAITVGVHAGSLLAAVGFVAGLLL